MESWKTVLITAIVSIVCAALASSGLWAFIQSKKDKNNYSDMLLLGLAHDRIIALGNGYIARGWITTDEYENLYDYLYVPYEKMGGNGSAKRVMEAVKKLEIRNFV